MKIFQSNSITSITFAVELETGVEGSICCPLRFGLLKRNDWEEFANFRCTAFSSKFFKESGAAALISFISEVTLSALFADSVLEEIILEEAWLDSLKSWSLVVWNICVLCWSAGTDCPIDGVANVGCASKLLPLRNCR